MPQASAFPQGVPTLHQVIANGPVAVPHPTKNQFLSDPSSLLKLINQRSSFRERGFRDLNIRYPGYFIVPHFLFYLVPLLIRERTLAGYKGEYDQEIKIPHGGYFRQSNEGGAIRKNDLQKRWQQLKKRTNRAR
jgi:hypothetical protein